MEKPQYTTTLTMKIAMLHGDTPQKAVDALNAHMKKVHAECAIVNAETNFVSASKAPGDKFKTIRLAWK